MANDLNQCNFIGRLGQDVELRYTQGGDAIANISLAVGWKTKDKEGAEWVRATAFGKLAEIMGQYLSKGSKIFISGRQRTRKWQGQDGKDNYTTEIVIQDMQMLDSRPQGATQGGHQPQQSHGHQPQQQGGYASQQYQQNQHPQQAPSQQPQQGGMNPSAPDFDDGIPF